RRILVSREAFNSSVLIVVIDDHHTVTRQSNVGLDAGSADLHGSLESFEGVFRRLPSAAAMRDGQRSSVVLRPEANCGEGDKQQENDFGVLSVHAANLQV